MVTINPVIPSKKNEKENTNKYTICINGMIIKLIFLDKKCITYVTVSIRETKEEIAKLKYIFIWSEKYENIKWNEKKDNAKKKKCIAWISCFVTVLIIKRTIKKKRSGIGAKKATRDVM